LKDSKAEVLGKLIEFSSEEFIPTKDDFYYFVNGTGDFDILIEFMDITN